MSAEFAEVSAVVSSCDADAVWVEIDQQGCGRCQEPGGCGGQQLTQALCTTPKTYRIPTQLELREGDRVLLGLPMDVVRRGATLAYIVPLAALVAGALAGTEIAGDPGAIAGGVAGLFVAWLWLRQHLHSGAGNSSITPHILSRL